MTTVTEAEELADEIAEAIRDTLDMDWQPSWAAPNIIAIINRERRLSYEAGAKAMQWQDIATAPRDGTRILLARYGWAVSMDGVEQGSAEWLARLFDDMAPREFRLFWTTSGFWSHKWSNWNDGCEPCGLTSPTHWMPVPSNPPVCAVPPAEWRRNRQP